MRISTRSRYGLRLMLYLASKAGTGPVFLKDIAYDEDISEKYLSQIIIPLKARGLIKTFRGAHGGYILGRPAGEISLRDILESLEGDLCLVDCVHNSSLCNKSSECTTRQIWGEMTSLLLDFLSSMTLEDLVKKSREVKSSRNNIYDFVI